MGLSKIFIVKHFYDAEELRRKLSSNCVEGLVQTFDGRCIKLIHLIIR